MTDTWQAFKSAVHWADFYREYLELDGHAPYMTPEATQRAFRFWCRESQRRFERHVHAQHPNNATADAS